MRNPAINPAILLSPVENGYVAYDTRSDRLHELNPIAALIAELCDGTRTVEKIRRTGETEPGANARSLSVEELSKLAKRLRQNGKIKTALLCQQRAAELAGNDA